MENRELHPNLQAALQLVEGIFQMLGSRYEVILHDLSHVESSIVALAGDVTHRKIGGPSQIIFCSCCRNMETVHRTALITEM